MVFNVQISKVWLVIFKVKMKDALQIYSLGYI